MGTPLLLARLGCFCRIHRADSGRAAVGAATPLHRLYDRAEYRADRHLYVERRATPLALGGMRLAHRANTTFNPVESLLQKGRFPSGKRHYISDATYRCSNVYPKGNVLFPRGSARDSLENNPSDRGWSLLWMQDAAKSARDQVMVFLVPTMSAFQSSSCVLTLSRVSRFSAVPKLWVRPERSLR